MTSTVELEFEQSVEDDTKWSQNMSGAWAAIDRGNLKQALKHARAGLRRAETLENKPALLKSLVLLSYLEVYGFVYTPASFELFLRTLALAEELPMESNEYLVEAHYNLAAYYAGTNQPEKIEEHLAALIEVEKRTPEEHRPHILFKIAGLYSDQRKPEAIPYYEEAFRLQQKYDPKSKTKFAELTLYRQYVENIGRPELLDKIKELIPGLCFGCDHESHKY